VHQEYRGSEWRRWELHLHTPFTKKEDRYLGKTSEEKWDNFYQTIDEYVGDGSDPTKAICAIAITDYLSIDNYELVEKEKRLPECVKLVIPNVELRIQPISSKAPINLHCFFSPSIVNQLQDRFFSRLKFEWNGNVYGATKSELIRLGRSYKLDTTLDEDTAYREGLSQYVISLDSLTNIFKDNKDLRDNTIIVVSNSSGDGASGLANHYSYFEGDCSQLDATRQQIYQFCDMIFSGNPSDFEYFLGMKSDDEDTIKKKLGTLKPCIHGCDAHTNSKVFEPDQKRYCWIKADPTFEGLKQVLYEPKERVRISSVCPDLKQSYHVIDKVVIEDNEFFSDTPIYLNDKLNCIIGGKSTGKSLLLHNVALAVDAKQVEEKTEKATTNVKQAPGVKVYWKDGACSCETTDSRKIVYIPQTYLNRLSDQEEETTEIDAIVQEIVMQKDAIATLFTKKTEKLKQLRQTVLNAIIELIHFYDEYKEINAVIKEIGDSKGINTEIESLTQRFEILSSDLEITDDVIIEYQKHVEQKQTYQGLQKILQQDKESIQAIETVVKGLRFPVLGDSELTEQLNQSVLQVIDVANKEWSKQKETLLSSITQRQDEVSKGLVECDKKLIQLKPIVESNHEIGVISKRILAEKEKLVRIEGLTKKLSEAKKSFQHNRSILENVFNDYHQVYSDFVREVNELIETNDEDLVFLVESVFRKSQFSKKILELFDNRSINRFQTFSLSDIKEENFLNQKNVCELIKAIVDLSLPIKAGYTKESILRELFNDWYNIHYIVKMGNDGIEDMSPGKKALVLLKLLVSLAESQCPILIDQPEDDLDNRSIYDELIQFIKTKKIDRQIIVVTHNANIVLGADAELVIVANQDGNSTPNNSHRFEYRGGSIENNEPVLDTNGKKIIGVLNQQGIPSHICEILEGGERAFDLRRNKYRAIMRY
jgi:hypothetical protein